MIKLRSLLLIGIFCSVFGNELSAQTFRPGVLFGLTTSQVGGDSYQGFNKLGLTFGGYVRYNLNDNWSTQFEIYYIQKGSRNDFSISTNDPSQSSEYFLLRLNYVEIPLLFRLNHRKFIYEIGPYYSQLVGMQFEWRNDNGSAAGPFTSADEFNSHYDFQYPLQSSDWGFILGVAYKITEKMVGSVRYGQGIMAIKKFESGAINPYPTNLNYGWTNTVISGTIRITFGEGDDR